MRLAPRGTEGTCSLLRLALRRDRILVPAWTSVLALAAVASAQAVNGLYSTLDSRVEAADAVNASAALVAMFGRIYDPTSLGAIAMVKMTAFGGAGVAMIAGMITVRHSRTEEETGRLELLGGAVVGRRAALSAALGIAAITSVLIGAVTALGLVASGLPASGSLAFGAAWAGAGLAFAGVGAVAAQLARTSRGATGLTVGVLGLAYVMRGIGDTSAQLSWLSWLSPLGWVHSVRAFAGNRWPVLALLVGFAGVMALVAYAIAARRDFGAGVLADRPGPARAQGWLGSTVGLAWRLERGALIAWVIAFAILGLVVGGVAGDVGSFLNTSSGQDVLGARKASSTRTSPPNWASSASSSQRTVSTPPCASGPRRIPDVPRRSSPPGSPASSGSAASSSWPPQARSVWPSPLDSAREPPEPSRRARSRTSLTSWRARWSNSRPCGSSSPW